MEETVSTYKRKPQWALDLEERADLIQRSQELQERGRVERMEKAQDNALLFLRSRLPQVREDAYRSQRSQTLREGEREFDTRPRLMGLLWLVGAAMMLILAGVVLGALLREWGLL